MATHTATKEYTIDAQGQKLGRMASQIAVLLMGKNLPEFSRNVAPEVSVTINNAGLLDISQKKLDEKIYTRWSGYPSGLKKRSLRKLIDDKGIAAAIEAAVYGMLPGNKLRPHMMKNLHINE